jgi:hypothetical protein
MIVFLPFIFQWLFFFFFSHIHLIQRILHDIRHQCREYLLIIASSATVDFRQVVRLCFETTKTKDCASTLDQTLRPIWGKSDCAIAQCVFGVYLESLNCRDHRYLIYTLDSTSNYSAIQKLKLWLQTQDIPMKWEDSYVFYFLNTELKH